MLHLFIDILRNSILITGLVVVMMMLVQEISDLFELIKTLYHF